MIRLTLSEATVTRYNETMGDWSGDEVSIAPDLVTVEREDLYKALNGLLDNYYYGAGLDAAFPDIWLNFLENADGCTSVVSYTGDDDGRYNDDGRYLVDLFFYVEDVKPFNILGWNY